MTAGAGQRLRVLLPEGQPFEVDGPAGDELRGRIEGVIVPSLKTWDGPLCTIDLREARVGTLVAAAQAVRAAAASAGESLARFLGGQPAAAPRPAEAITARDRDDIARVLQLGASTVEALRATWLGAPEVTDALARQVLADPPDGDGAAIVRLCPIERRGAAWLAIASDAREQVRHALFATLAPRYWFAGSLPLEVTPADALRLLTRGVSDPSPRTRARAVEWARLIGYAPAVADAVKDGAADPDADYRRQCLRTLGDVGDEQSRALALAAVDSADAADAAAAIASLKTIDDAEGIVRACLDPRRAVRIAAAEALMHSRTITAPLLARLEPPTPEILFAFETCRRRLANQHLPGRS